MKGLIIGTTYVLEDCTFNSITTITKAGDWNQTYSNDFAFSRQLVLDIINTDMKTVDNMRSLLLIWRYEINQMTLKVGCLYR